MFRFLSKSVPPFERVLVVESGSRILLEDLLPGVYDIHGPDMKLDLVTCYAGTPEAWRPDHGSVYRTSDYPGAAGRGRLYKELRANSYNIIGIVCAGEPILFKWKWMLIFQVPAKVFILNENGDYFWLDRGQWKMALHFLLFRAGLTGASAVSTIARLLFFPFTLTFLLLYAALVHLRRRPIH